MKSIAQNNFFYPSVLTICFFCLILIPLPTGSLYGSEGDWFSQHAALAEQFRQIFYETGRIFPDYTLLGGGSNIYDISYYGFLRPDVLVSFLLPMVPMTYIISTYAILELIATLNLCYAWLKRHLSNNFFAFLGTLFFICAACLFQAHRQIMFVNYLPFLFLALFGIDRLLSHGKTGLLTVSLFLFYLHSFYFSVAGLFVCFLYFLHQFHPSATRFRTPEFLHAIGKAAGSVFLSVGMAAILLLPTALDLLANRKDSGTSPPLAEIMSGSLSMDSLLYSPYSLGLTIICLYTLLLSIRQKSTRTLSLVLLLCLTVNIIPYLLSGLLYIRYKVLIPFLPLFLMLCTQTLEALYQKKIRHSFPALACCMIPAYFNSNKSAIFFDFSIMLTVFLLCHILRKRESRPVLLLLCLAPALVSLHANSAETYIDVSDNRQSVFSSQELQKLHLDKNYRFDCLTAPFATANITPIQGMGRSTIYSSVTSSIYSHFFYDRMRNPIRIRNRVALLTDANPFFSYQMGIRYIQTTRKYLPAGYKIIAQKGDTVIAENQNVLPIAYTTVHLPQQKLWNTKHFPENLSFLTGCDITPLSADTLEHALSDSGLCQRTKDGYSFTLKKETSLSLDLDTNISQKAFILMFDITSAAGDEILITVNGTRNKLSGKAAPYPNGNDCFTYLLSSQDTIKTLDITFSKGQFTISGIQAFLAELPSVDPESIIPFSFAAQKDNAVLKGTASLTEDGYFVTSLPYRKGYQIFVNGASADAENINGGFVGFPLSRGIHDVTIFYSPPGKNAGGLLSLLSILIFLIIIKQEKRKTYEKIYE